MFVFYDIHEKRVNKVFRICKKYLRHCQNSVFRGEITVSNQIKLKNELEEVIQDDDFVMFIKMMNKSSFEEEIIGNVKPETNFL